MKRFSVILVLGALIGGCVNMSAPPQQPAISYQKQPVAQRQSQQSAIHSWNASGAISVQSARQSPTIMRYQWRQQGPNIFDINLAASLNLAEVTITGRPHRVSLQKGNEKAITATTPEQLMQKSLGWSLPVQTLWFWARGLPAPGPNQGTQYDRYGHLISLKQNGWLVRYSNYHTLQNVDLPEVIELRHADISAKIVIKQWIINH
ncbi:MAG: outer membrane lipoprotein LolB [Proteobacteria bacterium]|nr:outer membrane lipoprotein LolB [Pseudomonadota bacterium]